MRGVPAAVAASALVVACVLVGAAAAARSSTALLPCKSSQLSLSGEQGGGPGSAGVGVHAFGVFSFTNTSFRACTLAGYPTFSAREPTGRTALQGIHHGGTYATYGSGHSAHAKEPVVLTPGHTAEFAVSWFVHQPSQYCLDPPTLYVTSAPPGNTRSLFTRFHITGQFCGPLALGSVALVII
jgi:hypothetical protein